MRWMTATCWRHEAAGIVGELYLQGEHVLHRGARCLFLWAGESKAENESGQKGEVDVRRLSRNTRKQIAHVCGYPDKRHGPPKSE